jgi:hypothetical protein
MLVRSLLVLLMLTGPMPVRECTCATATKPTSPPTFAPHNEDGWGHGHTHCKASTNCSPLQAFQATEFAVKSPVNDSHNHSHPVQHHPDCPAITPGVAAVQAVSPTVPVIPVESDGGHSTVVKRFDTLTPAHSGRRFISRPAARPIPLYLSLLTLQI